MKLLICLLPLLLAAGVYANATSNSTELAPIEDGIVQLPPIVVNANLETAKNALEAVNKFIDIFNSDIFAATPIKVVAEMLSKVLSFVISIINVIAGTNSESAEMKLIREQFKKVHAKLDSINLAIEDVKNLIEWRTTRVMYAEFEIFIQATSHMLDNYVTAPKAERDIRKRQFTQSFAPKRAAALKLYQAIVEKDFVVTENLAAAAVQYTKNHRRRVMNFLLAMNRIILRGSQLEIAYEKLQHSEAAAKITENDWKRRMERLVTRMKEVDTRILNVWHSQMQTDVVQVVTQQSGLTNEQFSSFMYRVLSDKFHWRNWFSLAYQDVSGFNNHAISHCNGVHHFRTHGNRNLAVASSDVKTSRFTLANGNRLLEQAESAGHRTNHAETWVNEINRRVGNNCDDAAFRGAICWGCNVWWTARAGRVAYRKIAVHGFVNAILFG